MISGKILIVALWLQYNKKWDDIYKALLNKTSPDEYYIEKAKDYIKQHGELVIITPLDEIYTTMKLSSIKHPPFVVNLKECK